MKRPTDPPAAPRAFGLTARLLLLAPLLTVMLYLGYLTVVLGADVNKLDLATFMRGYRRILQPAELRGAPLRTAQGGADLVYLLVTQVERIIPVLPAFGRRTMRPRQMLHVDVWAFDATTVQPRWRQRLRTFEDSRPLNFDLLGADGPLLWLFVHEPIGVSLRDGAVIADGARIEARNPAMAGKRVDQTGFVAFGAQGLQLTLSDSTQWIVDGDGLAAQPRGSAPTQPAGIVASAYRGSYTYRLQQRGLPLGTRWLGVLTDEEATVLQQPPVVPGARPGESRGAMAEFLESQHVPGSLTAQPKPYRLWSARVTQVSAAPRDWPAQLPDNWGKRDQFSDYQPLPEAPPFLQAGLLGDGRSPHPFWFRQKPDSVVVLHHDKVGDAGRLRLARVAGPGGRVVWDAALPLADLSVSMYGETHLALLGRLPNAAHDPRSETSRAEHDVLVGVAVASGAVVSFDLSAESVRAEGPVGTQMH